MSKPSWADEHASRIARTIKSLRGKRSGQWLAERTAELGHPVSRTTISEIETGRRKSVTTAELSVLAWALNVPPVRLLFPDLPDGNVEVVPGVRTSSVGAMTWFSGESELTPDDVSDDLERKMEVYRGRRLVDLSRTRIELESRRNWLIGMISQVQAGSFPESAQAFLGEVETIDARLREVNQEIRGLPESVVVDAKG